MPSIICLVSSQLACLASSHPELSSSPGSRKAYDILGMLKTGLLELRELSISEFGSLCNQVDTLSPHQTVSLAGDSGRVFRNCRTQSFILWRLFLRLPLHALFQMPLCPWIILNTLLLKGGIHFGVKKCRIIIYFFTVQGYP